MFFCGDRCNRRSQLAERIWWEGAVVGEMSRGKDGFFSLTYVWAPWYLLPSRFGILGTEKPKNTNFFWAYNPGFRISGYLGIGVHPTIPGLSPENVVPKNSEMWKKQKYTPDFLTSKSLWKVTKGPKKERIVCLFHHFWGTVFVLGSVNVGKEILPPPPLKF